MLQVEVIHPAKHGSVTRFFLEARHRLGLGLVARPTADIVVAITLDGVVRHALISTLHGRVLYTRCFYDVPTEHSHALFSSLCAASASLDVVPTTHYLVCLPEHAQAWLDAWRQSSFWEHTKTRACFETDAVELPGRELVALEFNVRYDYE